MATLLFLAIYTINFRTPILFFSIQRCWWQEVLQTRASPPFSFSRFKMATRCSSLVQSLHSSAFSRSHTMNYSHPTAWGCSKALLSLLCSESGICRQKKGWTFIPVDRALTIVLWAFLSMWVINYLYYWHISKRGLDRHKNAPRIYHSSPSASLWCARLNSPWWKLACFDECMMKKLNKSFEGNTKIYWHLSGFGVCVIRRWRKGFSFSLSFFVCDSTWK